MELQESYRLGKRRIIDNLLKDYKEEMIRLNHSVFFKCFRAMSKLQIAAATEGLTKYIDNQVRFVDYKKVQNQ